MRQSVGSVRILLGALSDAFGGVLSDAGAVSNSWSADVWEIAGIAKVACGRHSRHAISEQQF